METTELAPHARKSAAALWIASILDAIESGWRLTADETSLLFENGIARIAYTRRIGGWYRTECPIRLRDSIPANFRPAPDAR